MFVRHLIVAACCLVAAWAQQQQQYTTPIPILKQINKQNEDGSYSYGYEGADGSYKIETKHPTGEVYGKYGYVDDTGSLREIEYGANKLGFQPAGTGINVAPPTVPDPNNNNYVGPDGVDDGQYREDPSIYWKDPKYNQGAPRLSSSAPARKPSYSQPAQQTYSQPAQQTYRQPAQQTYSQPAQTYRQPAQQTYSEPAQQTYNEPAPQTYRQPQSFSLPSFNSQQSYSQPSYSQPSYSQPSYSQASYSAPAQRSSWARSWEPAAPAPAPVDYSAFNGHPASNFDVSSGSYSISYK